jgi:hypothetical protein
MKIVPALDKVEDSVFSLLVCSEAHSIEQLAFERSVKAFAHGVIVTISD